MGKEIMAQTASTRAYFARKAAEAKTIAAGGAKPAPRVRARRTPAASNDNRLYGPTLGRSLTVAVNDACLEAAGFEQHAGY
jgi:hypothetical protein